MAVNADHLDNLMVAWLNSELAFSGSIHGLLVLKSLSLSLTLSLSLSHSLW